MSVLRRLLHRDRPEARGPQPSSSTVTVERQSVCMGDDCTAPNGRTFDLPRQATLGDLLSALATRGNWVIAGEGPTTWTLRMSRGGGEVLAVLTCQPVTVRPLADLATPIPDGAVLHLDYLLQQDPDATVEFVRAEPRRTLHRLPS